MTDDARTLPEQRPSGAAPPVVDGPGDSEQSVRRLSELVLGASSLADRLQREPGHDPARRARVEQLRGFVTWAQNAIDRAVTDDAYAQAVVGRGQTPRRSRV